MSVNKVILVGNIGTDPEIRVMQSGDEVANFSLATSQSWKDKQTGERKEKTEWHKVVVFGGVVKVVKNYLKKGSKVYIEGQLETRSWEQDGQKRYATEVVLRGFNSSLVMLDGKKEEAKQATDAYAPASGGGLEDEIPFMRHNDFVGG